MQPTLTIALRAARMAGEQIARAAERLDIIKSEQESVSDFIAQTAIDAEKTAAYNIQKANPAHRVIGLHSGEYETDQTQGDTVWHINPINGVTNFANGLPFFALTLTCSEKGKAEHVVILNPITGEEFSASRGRGAQLNGRRIRVSNLRELNSALIGSDAQNADLDTYLSTYKQLSEQGAQIQSYGSVGLTLAYLAAGRIDACCLLKADTADLEAGLLLIQEAGGLMADFAGGNSSMHSGDLVAGNAKLFKNILQTLKAI